MHRFSIPIVQLDHGKSLDLPKYATEGAAGLDLLAAIREPITINPMARYLIPTGIRLAIPLGFEGQIRPRSGLALNHGLTVLNAPGTIDSDYRGEIQVLLINLGLAAVTLNRGDRIAQLVISQIARVVLELNDTLDATQREAGGFGSTGN